MASDVTQAESIIATSTASDGPALGRPAVQSRDVARLEKPLPNAPHGKGHWLEPEIQRLYQPSHGFSADQMNRWHWPNDSQRCAAPDPEYFCSLTYCLPLLLFDSTQISRPPSNSTRPCASRSVKRQSMTDLTLAISAALREAQLQRLEDSLASKTAAKPQAEDKATTHKAEPESD